MTDDADKKDGLDGLLDRLGKHADSAQKNTPQSDFFRAVKSNRAADVLKMLEAGVDPDMYNALGQTALHIAAISGAVDAARVLIDRGANPCRGKEADPAHTPLEDAVNFNKLEMVELLARMGGYTPGIMVDGWSLLHRACLNGKHLAVESLLRAGANCNEMTENGSTPLLIAIKKGHTKLVEVLLKFPAVVETMNECFVKTDKKKRTAFHLAIDNGSVSLISALIEGGANINGANAEGKTPLLCAIENDNLELVRLLVEKGADLNRPYGSYGTPLVYACTNNEINDDTRAPLLDLLVSLGADMDIPEPVSKMTPVHLVVFEARAPEVLAALLRYPVNKEARDNAGAPPLVYAAVNLAPSHAVQLLAAGADPNGRHGEDARTPLIQAVRFNNVKCIEALLQAGANPALYDGHGKSALSYAREMKSMEMIALLEKALQEKAAAKKSPPPSL